MSERRFTGVWIPSELWLDKSFSMTEKCLLVEIDSLDCSPKHCFASNAYFSDFMGCSVPTVTRSIKKLADRKLIEVSMVPSKNGEDRVIKMMRPPNQNDETPPNQNDEHSILLPLQTSKKPSSTPSPKHKHGEFQHVLLTTSELDKLKSDFPLDWKDRITRLDEYIEMKGAKYRNHNLTIRNWAKRDREKDKPNQTRLNILPDNDPILALARRNHA